MGLSNSTQKNEAQHTKQIFILSGQSGQSNMSGRGGVHNHQWDGVVPLECSPDASKIFCLNARLCWEVAHEPLHRDIDSQKICGVGPGMSFANAIKERVGVIGLVPCAVGGTRIKQWARGTHLYENMVRRARAAAAQGSEIKAMLWYQGESDTTSLDNAASYKENIEKLIHNVRADLHLPSLPIIQVAIASGEGKFIEKIRQVQKGIKIPHVLCVDAKGLQLKEDNLHLTTQAQVELGHMLAEAYLTHFVPSSDLVV
ncbi:unnamed protein product [Fraxinus pennsylvanica]|uniref:Sialate O-acetylesterase domain-containing protein n=1 Tax=Fraxinus pennsylvanica TaxID=56036 RepID=A0AAD2A572_9LAMI|nr:unnamed protein product [Fraxinus pennsylvanica]